MKRSTKKKIKNVVKNIALDLLQIIKDFGELIPDPFEAPSQYKWRVHMALGGYSADQINNSLYYLKKKHLVEKKKIKNRFVYNLTLDGKQKLFLATISQNKHSPKDGTSCIVIFDIPEEKRKHRRFLRRLLLKNGFMNIQRSVMIGPEFLPKEFSELLEDLKLRQNVSVIKGKILYS